MASLQKSLSQIGRTDSNGRIRSRPASQASAGSDVISPTGHRTRPAFMSQTSNQHDSVISETSSEQEDYNANHKKLHTPDSGLVEEEEEDTGSEVTLKVTQNGTTNNATEKDSQVNENGKRNEDNTTGGKLRFLQEMRDTDVYNQDSARFDVKFSGGGSEVKVKWFKNDMELCESAKYEFRTTGDRCSLIIRKCGRNDEGYYECHVIATNGSKIETAADLYVAGTGH